MKIVKKDFHAQLSKDLLKEQAECYEDKIIKLENKYEEKIEHLELKNHDLKKLNRKYDEQLEKVENKYTEKIVQLEDEIEKLKINTRSIFYKEVLYIHAEISTFFYFLKNCFTMVHFSSLCFFCAVQKRFCSI